MAPTSSYDATAVHKKGAQTMTGPLEVTAGDVQVSGTGSGVEFPDGSRQTTAGGGPSGSSGFILVYDVGAQGGGVVSPKTWLDTPQTVLTACTSSTTDLVVYIRCSHPIVKVNATVQTLPRFGDIYQGSVNVTVPVDGVVTVAIDGMSTYTEFTLTLNTPPELTDLVFGDGLVPGTYPGVQTEVKGYVNAENNYDTFQLSGRATKTTRYLRVWDHEAGHPQTYNLGSDIPAGTWFHVTMRVAFRAGVATLRPAKASAQSPVAAEGSPRLTTDGGGSVDGVNLINCCSTVPTLTFGTPTFSSGYAALKDTSATETATVPITRANLTSITYTSPLVGGVTQLDIVNPTLDEATKTVSRLNGNYNYATTNFRGVALRAANGSQTTTNGVVRIAHVACTIAVTEPYTRLRSGGNDGTSAQNYTITITSDQVLYQKPSMTHDTGGGTWVTNDGDPTDWTWSAGQATATRSLQIHDDMTKGTYTWQSPSVVNLAGKSTTAITGDATYVLGGFVARNLTFAAYSQTTTINTGVVTYTSLITNTASCYWSSKGAPPDQHNALRNATQGNHDDIIDTYTVDGTLPINTGPVTLFWNDLAAANANSTGTAQIIAVEELV